MAAIQGILTGVSRTSWTDTNTSRTKDKLHLYISRPFTRDDFTVKNAGSITIEITVPDEDIPMWEEEIFAQAEKMVYATYTKNKYNQNVLGYLKPVKK